MRNFEYYQQVFPALQSVAPVAPPSFFDVR
jgi:hypothetical protein